MVLIGGKPSKDVLSAVFQQLCGELHDGLITEQQHQLQGSVALQTL